ncbi:hypothetical protein B0H15DRAFT_40132 [Mycena belliarum]|uniref:Uncharacterized protein n=1 Tax=Mycena belliarum TaxID=1033014 RepID=A0AAD6TPZ1_9AGAR|nr:hypothetical protein B0H15DRAFT_40132 [Mycena belliae]
MIIYISALMLSEDARSGCRLPTRPLTNSMVILLQGPGSKAPVFLSENVDFCACGPQSICRSRPWPRTWTLISFPPRPRCGIAVPRAAATTRNAASSRGHTLSRPIPRSTLRIRCSSSTKSATLFSSSSSSTHNTYEDLKRHDKQHMEEVRENNKGAMDSKECTKAGMTSEDGCVYILWRADKLAMLLKPTIRLPVQTASRAEAIVFVPLRRRSAPAVAGA